MEPSKKTPKDHAQTNAQKPLNSAPDACLLEEAVVEL